MRDVDGLDMVVKATCIRHPSRNYVVSYRETLSCLGVHVFFVLGEDHVNVGSATFH